MRIFAGTDTLETSFTAAFVRLEPVRVRAAVEAAVADAGARRAAHASAARRRSSTKRSASRSASISATSAATTGRCCRRSATSSPRCARAASTRSPTRDRPAKPEDVTLFHRERKKNIAAYASAMKLSSRGRFFNEDDLVEYDVLDYDIDATFSPEREWLDGAHAAADSRQGVRAGRAHAEAGRGVHRAVDHAATSSGGCCFSRVRNQNSVVVNLPSPVARDLELTLDVDVSGPHPEPGDRSGVDRGAGRRRSAAGRHAVHPAGAQLAVQQSQPLVSAGAGHRLRDGDDPRSRVPATYTAVAERRGVAPRSGLARRRPTVRPRPRSRLPRSSRCVTSGVVVSKFDRVDAAHGRARHRAAAGCPSRKRSGRVRRRGHPAIEAGRAPKVPAVGARNTIAAQRSKPTGGRRSAAARRSGTAAEILRFYARAHRRCAVRRDDASRWSKATCPGGHSPGYFAVLNNPLPLSPYHVAQRSGGRSTTSPSSTSRTSSRISGGDRRSAGRTTTSSGSARASRSTSPRSTRSERRGEPAFRDVLRQFRRWAIDQSDQGADLSRLPARAHQERQPRLPRARLQQGRGRAAHAAAAGRRRRVLPGLRRYYAENRFKKAGTEDLQRAMEAEAGRSLERFFERWIFESGIPRIRYSTAVEGQELVVRFEQASSVADRRLRRARHGLDALRRQDRRRGRRRHRAERREALPADRHAAQRRSQRRRRITGGVREEVAARNGLRDTEQTVSPDRGGRRASSQDQGAAQSHSATITTPACPKKRTVDHTIQIWYSLMPL